MYGPLRGVREDLPARVGVLGGTFVSLWILGSYVVVPFAAGWIARDAFFLVEAAVRFFDLPIRYHVVGLALPGFLAGVLTRSRYRRGDPNGVLVHVRTIAGIVVVPVLVVWLLVLVWVVVVTTALLVGSDPGITPSVALSSGLLFLFGGTFLAVFTTVGVVAGVGSGTVVGYVSFVAVRSVD